MEIEHSPQQASLSGCNDPHERLQIVLRNLLTQRGLSTSEITILLNQLPRRWERLGDLLLLPEHSFTQIGWVDVLTRDSEQIWHGISTALKVRRLGRQHRIEKGRMRRSQAELLFGDDGHVEHKENGILFSFDATSVMFSSGNISERIRMANLETSNEIVLDLFAGIGYYTLPLLVHGKAGHVHACELNAISAASLRKNLHLNRVSDKCTIHEGDNQETFHMQGLAGRFDRVLLGLLPDSSLAWNIGLLAIKPDGGWMHLHGNARDGLESNWANKVINELGRFPNGDGRQMKIELENIEIVKSYAPKVNHCVLDIRIY